MIMQRFAFTAMFALSVHANKWFETSNKDNIGNCTIEDLRREYEEIQSFRIGLDRFKKNYTPFKNYACASDYTCPMFRVPFPDKGECKNCTVSREEKHLLTQTQFDFSATKVKAKSETGMSKEIFLAELSRTGSKTALTGGKHILFEKSYDMCDNIQWTYENTAWKAKIRLVDDNEYNNGNFCFEMIYNMKQQHGRDVASSTSMAFTLNHGLLPKAGIPGDTFWNDPSDLKYFTSFSVQPFYTKEKKSDRFRWQKLGQRLENTLRELKLFLKDDEVRAIKGSSKWTTSNSLFETNFVGTVIDYDFSNMEKGMKYEIDWTKSANGKEITYLPEEIQEKFKGKKVPGKRFSRLAHFGDRRRLIDRLNMQ